MSQEKFKVKDWVTLKRGNGTLMQVVEIVWPCQTRRRNLLRCSWFENTKLRFLWTFEYMLIGICIK